MNNTTTDTIRTKTGLKDSEGHDVRETCQLTIDWQDLTPEQERELAKAQVIVQYQRVQRAAQVIPTGDVTIKATDFCFGQRRKTIVKKVEDASVDELLAALKKRGFAI